MLLLTMMHVGPSYENKSVPWTKAPSFITAVELSISCAVVAWLCTNCFDKNSISIKWKIPLAEWEGILATFFSQDLQLLLCWELLNCSIVNNQIWQKCRSFPALLLHRNKYIIPEWQLVFTLSSALQVKKTASTIRK